MQLVLSATSSHLYCVLGDFHMSTDTFGAKLFANFLISTLVPVALNLLMKSHFTEWLKLPNSRYHCS